MVRSNDSTPEERARKRAQEFLGLLWHIAAFVIVNAFLWGLDLITGGGVEWAYWVTGAWGIGLLFHIAAYALDDSGFEDKLYRRFLANEEKRESSGGTEL